MKSEGTGRARLAFIRRNPHTSPMMSDANNAERMEDPVTHPFSARDLVHIHRGFSRLVWSIPIGILLFTEALRIDWVSTLRLPSYVLAAVLCCGGLLPLARVTPPGPDWTRHTRNGAFCGVLLFYFAPFVYWWTYYPQSDHLTLNVFALLFTAAGLMLTINRIAEALAIALGDRVFLGEARLCVWLVLFFIVAPLGAYFLYALVASWRYEEPLHAFIAYTRTLPSAHWLWTLHLLPVTLTIAVAWKAKERATRMLLARANATQQPFATNAEV